MITVELVGSYIAVHRASGISEDRTKHRNRNSTKSALPVLCRKLLEAGHDPDERVHVVRIAMSGDHLIPVFKRDRKLSTWAGVDVVENEGRGPHERKYVPYAGPVAAKEALVVTERMHSLGETQRLLNAANANTPSSILENVEMR